MRRLHDWKSALSRVGETKVWVPSIRSWMMLNPSDWVDRYLFIEGEYEAANLQILKSVCKPGSVVIDLGANVGWFTLAAANIAGPTGAVFSFEPAPEIFTRLSRNVALNQNQTRASITLINKAVGETNGNIPFYESTGGNSGLSSMRNINTSCREPITVPVIALDEMLGSLPPVTLIKLDIEGAEMKALHGMRELIARDKPMLMIELTDKFLREMGSSAEELCRLITVQGYAIHRNNGRGELEEVHAAPAEQCDVICQYRDFSARRAGS